MQGSASAPALPVLANEDYAIPSNGVGLTGHPKKVLYGTLSKDKGTYSSRINQIIKQAGQVPGPGHCIQHEPWDEGKTAHVIHAGNKFPAGTRDTSLTRDLKVPEPARYERSDIALNVCNSSKSNLSNRPRLLYGAFPKGKKRSFTDQAEAHGRRIPAPGHCDNGKNQFNNKANQAIPKVLDWSKGTVKTVGRGKAEVEIGPNHYSPSWASTEEALPKYAVPKAKAQNFLDKAVKEKLVDIRGKKEMPGPGTYNAHTMDDSKITRGTRYLQLRGMSRSAVSGYF